MVAANATATAASTTPALHGLIHAHGLRLGSSRSTTNKGMGYHVCVRGAISAMPLPVATLPPRLPLLLSQPKPLPPLLQLSCTMLQTPPHHLCHHVSGAAHVSREYYLGAWQEA